MTDVDTAKAALTAATTHLLNVQRDKSDAIDRVTAEWAPKVREARRASDAAARAVADAITAATVDHALQGRRVSKLEEIKDRWTRKVTGHNRINGVIDTFRPGTDLGRRYGKASNLSYGDPFVRVLLKSGKVGTSTISYVGYSGHIDWHLADEGEGK